MEGNTLYYGDNLDILRRYIPDESVDLIYLDPPFNSQQAYNVIFEEDNGTGSASQIEAFDDTWHWTTEAMDAYEQVLDHGGQPAETMRAFRAMLDDTDMMAYLAMMAPRLIELRRVLKETGSIYLHCDPTASHYLKVLMDGIFDGRNFLNEIIWRYEGPQSPSPTRFATKHDVCLRYARDAREVYAGELYHLEPVAAEDLRRRYRKDEDGRYFYTTPKGDYTDESIQRLEQEGRVLRTRTGKVRIKYFLTRDEAGNVVRRKKLADVWDDIPSLGLAAQAEEKLGYPTQKPEALLERIIQASSNEGDLVLDPFCGCGTTIAVAHRLKRRWIGIDITHIAVNLMKTRLRDTFGEEVESEYEVMGEPTDLAGARQLAGEDRLQFESWALGLVGARQTEKKPGADRGIDGRLYFHDASVDSPTRQIILSVKSGGVGVSFVRDLRGVVDREEAALGVLITLEPPTKPMVKEAASGGFYHPPHDPDKKYPKIQILTIEDLLEGAKIDCPYAYRASATFKRAPRAKRAKAKNQKMNLDE